MIKGLKNFAVTCRNKAEFMKDRLSKIKDVSVMKSSPTFNEFTVKLPVSANEVIGKMIDNGIAAGFPLGRYYSHMENYLLVAVTEKRNRHDIIRFSDMLEDILWS